jgi:hypothetical protein
MPTHTLRVLSGSIAIPVIRGMPTAGHSSAISTGSRSQSRPSLTDRNTQGSVGVPVPANITFVSVGSTATAHTI